VHDLVRDITPGDAVEAEHQANTLRWLEATDDVFRRVKPATPTGTSCPTWRSSTRLMAAACWWTTSTRACGSRRAGHVKPGEHPAATARREIREELAIEPVFIEDAARPSFITVTRTTGTDRGHLDVSLWFLLVGERGMPLTIDRAEFTDACWWTPADVLAAGPGRFDPHYWRFMTKMRR